MLLGDGMDRRSLAHKILSQLPLAQQTAAWGTLGTIKPYLGFDAESDVQHLVEAIAGNGADHGAILDVLTNRTSTQRQQITKVFEALTKQDLLKSMEAALSGNLERVIVGLLKPPAQYDAHELRAAMQGMGTDEDALTEILSTRSNQQLRESLAFYQQDFKADPEKDIALETSGWFKEILLALAKGKREHYTGIIDYALIQQDAEALADPGARSEGAGERTWISIFTQRSPEHLSRVFGQYRKSRGLEVEDTICKRFRGDGQAAMLALASVCRNTPRYFAERLHNAMKGPGTDDKVLIRILISRSETDLLSIRSEFKKHHGKSLYSCLQVETRGDYQAALLALCRAEDL
ncbi:nuclear receptor coactivator 4 [Platysternon megacephalum]|uniref:Nuclear receptor coactivator 4 n=1 Tax=Platysternon megacephalum TaxID=55544 RepID=A0A4D9EE21_9SAUR|nr:nuclear receptor coactivator 4 [Platysternon megacephalum]